MNGRKFTLLLISCLMAHIAFGQSKVVNLSPKVFVFPIEQGGTVSGVNGFMDLEKAQRMIYTTGNFSVTSILAFFGEANVIGDGNLSAKIYEVDETTNGPGVLVGTSDAIKVSEINLDPEFVVPTPFIFSNPAPVAGNYS